MTLASRIAALRAVVGKMTPGLWEAITAQQGFIVTAKDQIYDVAVVRNIGNEDNEANACGIVALRNEAIDLITALEYRLAGAEAETIERCAKVVEAEEVDGTVSREDRAYNHALAHAAAAIRASKETGK